MKELSLVCFSQGTSATIVLIYKGLAPVWKNSGSHDLIMTYYADSDGEGEFGKSTHQILNIGSHGSKNVGFKDDLFSHKTMYPI